MSQGDSSEQPTYSTQHPHEPEIPPVLDPEGRCLICGLLVELDSLREQLAAAERERDTLRAVERVIHKHRKCAEVAVGRLEKAQAALDEVSADRDTGWRNHSELVELLADLVYWRCVKGWNEAAETEGQVPVIARLRSVLAACGKR